MMQVVISAPYGKIILAEVACTQMEQARGLSHWRSLPPGRGMLLAFPQAGRHAITMRGMKFDLDVLWLNEDLPRDRHQIVWYVGNAGLVHPATLVNPLSCPASYVLELAAGEMRRLGLRLGDALRF